MRLRLKIKISNDEKIEDLYLDPNNYLLDNNKFELGSGKNMHLKNKRIPCVSFCSLITKFIDNNENIDINLLASYDKIFNILDEKSKKFLFPVNLNRIKTIYDLMTNITLFLNEIYYNFNSYYTDVFKISQTSELNPFRIVVLGLSQSNYSLIEDFKIKEMLNDNDKVE